MRSDRKRRRRRERSISDSPPPPECLLKKRRKVESVNARIAELTMVERKVWIGGLSVNDLGDAELKEIFTRLCPDYGITRRSPIHSVWLAKEKNFCFVEFRNIRDAEKALSNWKNISLPLLGTKPLSTGIPRERTSFSDELDILKDYVLGDRLPNWTSQQYEAVQNKIHESRRSKKTSEPSYRHRIQRPPKEVNIPIPGKGSFQAQTQNPDATRVLRIKPRKKSDEQDRSTILQEAARLLKKTEKYIDSKEDDCLWALFRNVDSAIIAKRYLDNQGRNHFRVKFVDEKNVEFGKTKGAWQKTRA